MCHDGPITGIAVDAMNAIVITTGTDGFLKTWRFNTHLQDGSVDVGSPITQLEICKDSGTKNTYALCFCCVCVCVSSIHVCMPVCLFPANTSPREPSLSCVSHGGTSIWRSDSVVRGIETILCKCHGGSCIVQGYLRWLVTT